MRMLHFLPYLLFLSLVPFMVVAQPPKKPKSIRCVDQILRTASAMRNISSSANHGKDGQGSFGTLLRVTFEDGIVWAAKVFHRDNYAAVSEGLSTLEALQKYCPDRIPGVLPHGGITVVESDSNYFFHFMDWVEGVHPRFTSITPLENGWNSASLPETFVLQLAQFVNNLTTCRLPTNEITRLFFGGKNSHRSKNKPPNVTTWGKARFITSKELLTPNPRVGQSFTGLDILLLFVWASDQFVAMNPADNFVLHYWDIHTGNFKVNPQNEIIAVLDWDGVHPVPLALTRMSLSYRLFLPGPPMCMRAPVPQHNYILNASQDELFLRRFRHLDLLHNSTDVSQSPTVPFQSHLIALLNRLLVPVADWNPLFVQSYTDSLKEILERSQENLKRAMEQWVDFTNTFYKEQNRPVPDWPFYVQVQEELGIYGSTERHRIARSLKRSLRIRVGVLLQRLRIRYKDWTGVRRAHCYLTAMDWPKYILPSGGTAC